MNNVDCYTDVIFTIGFLLYATAQAAGRVKREDGEKDRDRKKKREGGKEERERALTKEANLLSIIIL